jgi:hypothetical protein
MPRSLAERLEGLSAYRNIFPPHDPQAALNPVAFSHMRVNVGGTLYHVLSRVGFAGLDYTNRTNKFAHHVVLDPDELPRGGPAWLLSQPGFAREIWDGTVGYLAGVREVPQGDDRPRVCRAWQAATGDSGWAGVCADAFLADPRKPLYLVFEPGQDLLPLVAEALALLPPDRRWEVTFSTYFTTLPQGVSCAWRGVVRDSPEALTAARTPQALILDLGPSLGAAPPGARVEQARTGRPAVPIPPTGSTPPPLSSTRFASSAETPRTRRSADVPAAEIDERGSTLPTSAAPPPLPQDAAPSPSRHGRRTALIVGAVCFLLMLGGLAASRRFRPASEGKTSVATVARSQEVPPKKKPIPPEPGPTLKLPDENPEPASKKAEKPHEAETAKATSPEPKAPEPVKPPDPPPIEYVRSSRKLPSSRDLLNPGCDLLESPFPPGAYTIALLGLKDPPFSDLLETNRADGRLVIRAKPSGKELAVISGFTQGETLHFHWGEDLRKDVDKSLNALRSCVVSVETEGETPGPKKVYRVALRKSIDLTLVMRLDQIGSPQAIRPINWGNTEKPFGRMLQFLEGHASNRKVEAIGAKSDTKEAFCFRFVDFDHVKLKAKLSQPVDTAKPRGECNVSFEFDPEDSTAKNRVKGELHGYLARFEGQLPGELKERGQPAHKIVELFGEISDSSHSKSFDLEVIKNKLNDALNKVKEVQMQIETRVRSAIEDNVKESVINSLKSRAQKVDGITKEYGTMQRRVIEAFETLNDIRAIRADRVLGATTLKFTLAIDVEGEPVEVVHVGVFDSNVENKAAAGKGRTP